MLINGKLVKLGKRPALKVPDPRNLKLSHFLKKPKAALPPEPPESSWIVKMVESGLQIPVYMNDTLGTCVPAAAGHMIQQWNWYAGHPWQPTDDDILRSYIDVGGYVPGDPNTDNGVSMASFLKYWQQVGIGGHKILAYLSVNSLSLNEVQNAIQLFGCVFTGIQLPVSAQGETSWTVPEGGITSEAGWPGGWGGHGVTIVAASPQTRTCETWGTTLKMSNNFERDYVDEMWAVLSQDWLSASNTLRSGIDLAKLESKLKELGITSKLM